VDSAQANAKAPTSVAPIVDRSRVELSGSDKAWTLRVPPVAAPPVLLFPFHTAGAAGPSQCRALQARPATPAGCAWRWPSRAGLAGEGAEVGGGVGVDLPRGDRPVREEHVERPPRSIRAPAAGRLPAPPPRRKPHAPPPPPPPLEPGFGGSPAARRLAAKAPITVPTPIPSTRGRGRFERGPYATRAGRRPAAARRAPARRPRVVRARSASR
jgi:hypothetical protein